MSGSPRNSCVKNLKLNVMVLGAGAFGRYLGPEDTALMNAINYKKKMTQSSLTPSAM